MTSGVWRLASGLLAGAVLRALALPLPGTGDVEIWKVWSFAATHDLTGVYGVGGSPPERRMLHWQGTDMTVDYPPFSVEQLALAGRMYALRHPLFEDSRSLNVAMKIPGVVAEAAFVAVILTWFRRRFGADAARWTALAFWLSPGAILDGPVLGYLDPQTAIPAALALAAVFTARAWLAGPLLALAVLTKAQALFAAPVIVAALIWRTGADRVPVLARAAAGAALVAIVGLLPFVARGALPNIAQAVGRLATHDMMSGNAANLWWIATWILRVLDVAGEWGWWPALTQQVRILGITRAIALGYPNPRAIGLILVALSAAWVMWRMRKVRTLADGAVLAGWLAFAYAQLAAQVHENHLYLALPFLALAGGLDRRYRIMFWWVSGVFAANLLLFEGLGRGMPAWLDRRWTGIDTTVLLAAISVGLFAWMTARLWSGTPSPSTPQSS